MDKSADAFRTISEVADDLDLPPHVLRFWETKFPAIQPMKRAGGRRYYRPADVDLLRTIRRLLYEDGYTIKGVQRLFKERGEGDEALSPSDERAVPPGLSTSPIGSDDAAVEQPPSPAVELSGVAGNGSTQSAENDTDAKPALQTEAVLTALELLTECEDILARSRTGR